MTLVLTLMNTRKFGEETRPHIEDFLKGRISYVTLCNRLEVSARELDRILADMVSTSVKKNAREAVLRH